MKLTKVAVVVVAVVGTVAVGGSWYTGKQVEQRYQEFLQRGNQSLKQLATYGVIAEIKDVQFQRHFFSSDVKYTLEAKVDDQIYAFKGDDKLFHGPLPLNRLMKGNLSPVLASVENNIQLPENLKVYFNNQDKLGEGKSDISYSGAAKGEFKINPIQVVEEGTGSLTLSESNYIYAYDPTSNKSEVEVKLESIKGTDAENIETNIQGLSYKFNSVSDNQYPLLTLGEYTVSIKQLSITDSEDTSFAMLYSNFSSTGKSNLQKDRVISSGDAKADIELQKADKKLKLGQFNMDLLMDMDAKSTNDFTQYLTSPDKLASEEAGQIVQSILMKSPKLEVKNLSVENEKGKNSLSLNISLDNFDLNKINSFDSMLKIFKASHLDAKLSLPSLEALATQMNEMEGMTKEEATQQAKLLIEDLVNNAQASTLAEIDSENIKMKLTIDQGKVNLNGRDLPEEDVQGMLLFLVLGLGAMGIQ